MSQELPKYRNWFGKVFFFLLLELVIIVAADSPIKPTADVRVVKVEDPEPGVNLTPEELVAIDINEAMRDRLRADPRAQPILKAIRKELLFVKWRLDQQDFPDLPHPIWERYGAKILPLLDYYTQSGDRAQQEYGMRGIQSLGKPYSTLWLKKQIKRRSHLKLYQGESWTTQFGLDDPQIRDEIIRLAYENLEPRTASFFDSPNYENQFNYQLLESLVSKEELEAQTRYYPPWYQEVSKRKQEERKVVKWERWKKLKRLDSQQTQQMLAEYRNLSEYSKSNIQEDLAQTKPGKLSTAERALLSNLIADTKSTRSTWLIAQLDYYKHKEVSEKLQEILNGDLRDLNDLTRYSDGSGILSILVRIAKKYPDSRFIQGCREYGDLTGRTYFGYGLRSPNHLRWLEQRTPAEMVAYWQDWLNRYPDHPGADDATDHLARYLLKVGDAVGATRQWIKLMTQSVGDGDARWRGYPRVKTMLDVGLSIDQIQELLKYPESEAIAPLLRYAIAIHHARNQNYGEALQTSAGLNLNQMSHLLLGRLSWQTLSQKSDSYYDNYYIKDLLKQRQQMQEMLTEQRGRWQQLLQWQQKNTPETKYKIASSWADLNGWKNGYLPVWEGYRRWDLPTFYDSTYKPPTKLKDKFDDFYTDECRRAWVCDLSQRNEKTVRDAYQHANSNAVALALYQKILDNLKTPASIREKTLYMVGTTLLWQKERFYLGETLRIHPPAGVVVGSKRKRESDNDVYIQNGYYLEYDVAADYQRRIDGLIAELQKKFPKSSYIDDLLISNYFLSWKPGYLKQIVEKYPESDRAEEARFLLNHPNP